MHYRQRTSRAVSAWISDSDYTHGGEVVCGLRDVYRGVWGCPAWAAGKPCSYCFLKGTVRGKTELLEGVAWGNLLADCEGCCRHEEDGSCRSPECDAPIDVSPARAAVEKWLKAERLLTDGKGHVLSRYMPPTGSIGPGRWPGDTQLLNTGEYTDSLGWTPEENPHLAMLLDLFSDPETNPHDQKLLLVSKAGLEATKAHLVGRQPSENVILSWSVGNLDMEPHWVPPLAPGAGLDAAIDARAHGWRVRLRLDPLDTLDNHSAEVSVIQHAINVAEYMGERQPEMVTLGTLRRQGGRVFLPEETRANVYQQAVIGLRRGGYEGPIGLCKETPDMIRTILGIDPHEMRCNCLL